MILVMLVLQCVNAGSVCFAILLHQGERHLAVMSVAEVL